MSRDTFHSTRLFKTPSNLALNIPRDVESACNLFIKDQVLNAVCSGSYKLSRYLLVKIITVFCSSSYCDYRVLLNTCNPIQASFSLISYRNEWDGITPAAACVAAPSTAAMHHGPPGQPGPDPHRVGVTRV